MKAGQGLHHISIGVLALLSCALGILNAVWLYGSSDGLTMAQIVFDALAGCALLAAAVALTIQARKSPDRLGFSDEYAGARRRYASQIGLIAGLVLFVISLIAKTIVPDAFDFLIDANAGKRDAFFSGHMMGGYTFYIGVMIGWVVAYIKYR